MLTCHADQRNIRNIKQRLFWLFKNWSLSEKRLTLLFYKKFEYHHYVRKSFLDFSHFSAQTFS